MIKNFIKNTKGAVTVFVTLLLIPAVLISGTAVDLTRLYTARSIVQDANQLAANSVLSQYNALLQDLYGVFGVAKDDPVLAELLDEYISITVFGESRRDTSLGTLQLFYGSNLSLEDVEFAENMHLRNPDVLSRQIEEYMKFRGPVIIVKEVMELLGSSTFKEDTEVIQDKLDIDETIALMHEKYKQLYEAILEADKCTMVPSDPASAVGVVSRYLVYIRDEFARLKSCYENWEKYYEKWEDEEDADKKAEYAEKIVEYEEKYKTILNNIRLWTVGGAVAKDGGGTSNAQGLNKTIENAILQTDRFKPEFDEVVAIAREIDALTAELSQKIDKLEERLNSGQCNEELRAALTERTPGSDKSIIEMYKDILKWDDIEGMAITFKDGGYEYIDGPLKDMLRDVGYRNKDNLSAPSLTRAELENIRSYARLQITASNNIASKLSAYSNLNISYNMPPGFLKFGEHSGDNKPFFEELEKMMKQPAVPPIKLYDEQEEASGSNSEKKQENMIDELMEFVNDAYAGLANNPLGAKYVNGSSDEGGAERAGNITDSASEVSAHPIVGVISDPLGTIGRAGDYILLLTYCTSMFSNYTTARPEINGKKKDELDGITFPKSMSGIPLKPEVNYFFQSEWEYLYNGSENAGKNLSAVSRLIYLVRMICNYITVFSVSEVSAVINSIRAAFSWNPPLSVVLGELARAAFVAAESTVDVANLRAGYKVPLIKSGKGGEWLCSPSGLVKALESVASDTVKEDDKKNDKGLEYSHYLLFFFLAKGVITSDMATTLTNRAADLIEWNIVNYKGSVCADEEKMTEALSASDRFRLGDMKTDFSITTTVDLRMLFLSMVFSRNFSNSRGIGMPQTMPVSVTDYRGY